VRVPLIVDLPGRDQAREAAQRELSKSAYRAAEPPWYQRLLEWIANQLGDLIGQASGSVPGGYVGLLVLALLVALVVAVVVVRLRPARRRGLPEALFGSTDVSAAGHRALADEAAARGAYADAVRERLRAVVRELEERGVLDPRPGRTADELARDAGTALPDLARPLAEAARLFDDVWYGGHPADASAYAALVALDTRVRAARPVLA
jgi:Domain of unknown function (DUF4129)